MSRLPTLRFDDLDPTGQALWNDIVASRGESIITAEGGLAGPFNPWLTVPEAGTRLLALGSQLRFATAVDRRLHELAIVTVGARWHAEFEWWAHSRWAREQGISQDVIDALAAGTAPEFTREDERIVHAIASQLVTNGQIDRATYDAGIGLLGEPAMVEIVLLCGYYTIVSFTLNAFAIGLPPGVEAQWGASG